MTKQKVEAKRVTWAEFGEKIDVFITKNGNELSDVDLIIGFTRGGMILATTMCTLLRDVFQEKTKVNSSLWSLRPLPSGITTKNYRDPCFVMDSPMAEEEAKDCKKLLKDIRRFMIGKRNMKILLVDDNLTGATRLLAYKDFIRRKIKNIEVKTLAYSRLECFSHPKVDYLIDPSHPANKYIIMPYHRDHGTLELPSLKTEHISLTLENPVNFECLPKKIKKIVGPFSRIKAKKGAFVTIGRGASIIDVAMGNKELKVIFLFSKYYPPKKCLETSKDKNLGTFEQLSLWSLCNLGAVKADNVCFYCSALNCNRDLLKIILQNCNPSANFEVRQLTKSFGEKILTHSVRLWLENFKKTIHEDDKGKSTI